MSDEGLLLGRRGFLGAGLAGAGAALVGAAARPVAARAQAAPATTGPIGQLPVRAQYPHLPAIPLDPAGTGDTLARLQVRAQQLLQARQSRTDRWTIGGRRHTGYDGLYGAPSQATPAPSLENPEQFAMGWTTLPDVQAWGRPHLSTWAATLTDPDVATRQFWPTIAQYGTAYNLILPERVRGARARALRATFGPAWTRALRRLADAGALYVIDLRRFESLRPQTAGGATRFTPATVTLLARHPRTGALTPVAIAVSGPAGAGRRVYTRAGATDGAWLYALQAAKASITVYGVWLGHVYHWHIVTAAMQMTMLNTLTPDHPVHQLLAPQSKFLIPFDQVLLELWPNVAPPTSLTTADQFLALCNDFAADRGFFDDDPRPTLAALGLRRRDFSDAHPWDRYPVVQRALAVWDMVADYVATCVRATYASDAAVAGDGALQAWMAVAGAPDGGNVRGLPALDGRAALTRLLTSLVYRVTVHGIGRLARSANPALTFVANFPQTLQRADIPSPRRRIDTAELLTYLPNTATIGSSLSFYDTFAFSTPYEPFIPLAGPDGDLFFPGGPASARNRALITLRRRLAAFIEDYEPATPQYFQWPRNIET